MAARDDTTPEQYSLACKLADKHASTPPGAWERSLENDTPDPLVRELALSMLESERHRRSTAGGLPDFQMPLFDTEPLPRVVGKGKFRLLELIDQGGMGRVYRAEQLDLERVVAVKQLQLSPLSAASQERLLDEARALAKIQDPGVAQIFEVQTGATDSDDSALIAMELVEGLPLDQAPAYSGALPVQRSARRDALRARLQLMLRICRGVQAAHARMVIHCDLKPSNVVVTADGLPKVIDFGIARRLAPDAGQVSGPAAGAGTLRYMSPERLASVTNSPDVRWDVYSLGIMLVELLLGRSPFYEFEPTVDGMRRTILEHGPTALEGAAAQLTPALQRIVLQAVARDPGARFATVAELADAIDRELGARVRRQRRVLLSGLAVATLGTLAYIIAMQAEHGRAMAKTLTERDLAAAQAHATAADFALARGGWKDVVNEVDAGLAARHPEPDSLRVRRLRALVCLGDHAAARRALDDLAPIQAGSRLEGERLLLDGVLSFHEPERSGKALTLVEAALECDLSPADSAFALGLLAESGDLARNCFVAAVSADSFHFLAWHALMLTQMILGQLKELDDTSRSILFKFPEDTTALANQVLLAAFRGESDRCSWLLETLKVHLGSRHHDRLRIMADAITTARKIFSISVLAGEVDPVPLLFKAVGLATQAGIADREDAHVLFAHATLDMRFVTQSAQAYATLVPSFLGADWQKAMKAMDDVLEACPSSMNLLVRAMMSALAESGDYVAQEQRFRAILEREPMFPELTLLAHYGVVVATAMQFDAAAADASDAARARVLDALREAQLLEGFPPQVLDQFARIAANCSDTFLARLFIARWLRDRPDDLDALEALLHVELKAFNRDASIHLAEKLMRLEPQNPEWKSIRDMAVESLRVEVENHPLFEAEAEAEAEALAPGG